MPEIESPEPQAARISAFAAALAAHTPAPGGGAAAAAAVAMGAALVQMAAHYVNPESISEDARRSVAAARTECAHAQSAASAAVDDDSHAYLQFRQALRLPRANERQRARRRTAIQDAAKEASRTSLKVLEAALAVISAGAVVVELGNPRLASDAGGGGALADAAARIALANLESNLRSCPEDIDRRRWREYCEAARRRLSTRKIDL